MWTSSKVHPNKQRPLGGQLELRSENLGYFSPNQSSRGMNFSGEYFKRLSTNKITNGVTTVPGHRILADGRVYRQYGVKSGDVSHEFLAQRDDPDPDIGTSGQYNRSTDVLGVGDRQRRELITSLLGKPQGSFVQSKDSLKQPPRQYKRTPDPVTKRPLGVSDLYQGSDPVNYSKQAILQDKQRRESIGKLLDCLRRGSQDVGESISSAVVKNEIAPTEDDLIYEQQRRLAGFPLQQEGPLPQKRRQSIEIAKRIAYFAKLKTPKKQPWPRQKARDFLNPGPPLPAISGRNAPDQDKNHSTGSSGENIMEEMGRPEEEDETYPGSGYLKESMDKMMAAYKTKEGHMPAHKVRSGKSVKKHLWDPDQSTADGGRSDRKNDGKTKFAIDTVGNDGHGRDRARLGLLMDSGAADASSGREYPRMYSRSTARDPVSSYKLRHEYGKNLERNWFKSFLRKTSGSRKRTANTDSENHGLRLDIFYSPEPQSDDDDAPAEAGDSGNIYDETADSMQCTAYSTATGWGANRGLRSLKRSTSMFNASDRVIEEGSQDNSSGSDIEIVMKDNQLIQRKTKHKMQKKRQRQLQRYKAFLPPPESAKKHEDVVLPLTDHEIRALRLNLRKKNAEKRLTGKRKFLQVANVVYATVLFRKIMLAVRRRKKAIMRRTQKRIAAVLAKPKKVNWKRSETPPEPERTPTPTLKDTFMKEIGNKLVRDVAQLGIAEQCHTADEQRSEDGNESDDEDSGGDSDSSTKAHDRRAKTKDSKIVASRRQGSAKEGSSLKLHRYRERRHSFPLPGRPLEFRFEVLQKPKRQRSKSTRRTIAKEPTRRIHSPAVPKCTCYRSRQIDRPISSISILSTAKCPHPHEENKPKYKTVVVQTAGLFRPRSLQNLAKMTPIELSDLLRDVDIPAKEVRLEILKRKFRKQRRKRGQIRLSPVQIQKHEVQEEAATDSDSGGSDVSMRSDYGMYGCPHVNSGVSWHQTRDRKLRQWTMDDVDREMKRLTHLFDEMKECRYLRLDDFSQAVVEKINQTETGEKQEEAVLSEELIDVQVTDA